MTPGPEPSPGPSVTVRAGRVYILPSTEGWALLLALLVMLIGAINYAAALAYALVFLLVGVLLVTPLHTQGNLLGLTLRLRPVPPVHAGDTARLAWTVIAADGRPRPGLELGVRARTDRRARTLQRRFGLPADRPEVTVEISWPAPTRGRLTLPRLQLATRYPLGLFRAWTLIDPGAEVLVWPAVVDRLPPPLLADIRGGGASGGSAPGADEFRGLAAYRPGDPPRRLAWRAWRPGSAPPVKHFGSGEPVRVFDWDDTRALGNPEARLSQLAAWVLAADRAGAPYGLRLPGSFRAPATGGPHREAVMAALALYGHPA